MPVMRYRTLRVLPNPWQYIDHKGRPAGVCPCDPNEHTPDRRWVGATIGEAVQVRSPVVRVVAGVGQTVVHADHDLRWTFSEEPVEIPNTGYYRDRVMGGELIAADVQTYTACGGTPGTFKSAKDVLVAMSVSAIERFDAENGQDAFKILGEQYAEDEDARLAALKSAADDRDGVLPAVPAPTPIPAVLKLKPEQTKA